MTTTAPAPAVVPSFDNPASEGRKLAIICSKGNLDMAYPGLILANAALGEGVETHLFFTFWGFDMITKSRMHDLKFTMLGNTATHLPQGLGGLPGMTAMATHQMKKQIQEIGVPDVPEFLHERAPPGPTHLEIPIRPERRRDRQRPPQRPMRRQIVRRIVRSGQERDAEPREKRLRPMTRPRQLSGDFVIKLVGVRGGRT